MPQEYKGLLDQYGKPLRVVRPKDDRRTRGQPRAVIDAAQDTDQNTKHWANADGLSAAAANSPDVRRKLRNRARYECQNNSYAGGLVARLANDCIGTGPRLQLAIPGADDETVRAVERSFAEWAADPAVDFADTLRVLDESCVRDGESFALFVTNPAIAHQVQLALRPIEADQVATPGMVMTEANAVDGIRFDAAGNPVEYHVLKTHPGDTAWGWSTDFTRVPAEQVIHWYTPKRAGEKRGLPEITAALPVFSQLRRYCLAVLTTAENAANISGVLETDFPPEDLGPTEPDKMQYIEPVRGAYATLPRGMKLRPHESGQPTTEFGDFKRESLNETGAGVNAPLNVVTGNSSGYNFSSGRLDHIPYHRGLWIRRARLKIRGLDRTVRRWGEWAINRIADFRHLPHPATWGIDWQWDGFDSIDPEAEAATDAQDIENMTVTRAEICARKGTNVVAVFKQLAAEKKLMEELGLTSAEANAAVAVVRPVRPDPADPDAPAKNRAARRQRAVSAGEAAYA